MRKKSVLQVFIFSIKTAMVKLYYQVNSFKKHDHKEMDRIKLPRLIGVFQQTEWRCSDIDLITQKI